jgi:GPH family glycoside/pentoside/hexuronide:cation symporter
VTSTVSASGDSPEAPDAPGSTRLAQSVLWAYCLPLFGMNGMGILFSVYLMMYATDVLLIAPAAMGLIFFIGRGWDAVSDPLAGYLSDRSTAKRGRRRAWLYASAVPVGAAMVMLWSPPSMLTGVTLVVWVGFAYILYETASTAFWVPHGALGMELTPDYHERTRLFAYRHVIGSVGLGLGLGAVWLVRTGEQPREMALLVSIVGGALVAGMILFAALRVPERAEFQGRGAVDIRSAFADVFRNPHGRLLVFVYAIETFGTASLGMLAPYVMKYVINAPDLTEVFIMMYVIPTLAFTPAWIWASRRVGKKKLWLFAMVATMCAYTMMFFVSEASYLVVFVVVSLLGIGSGCGAVVAPSIQADVIDYDEYMTGDRKEGAYVAVWNFLRKAAGGVTAMATGLVLQAVGYDGESDTQSAETQTAIMALIGLLPAVCYGIAIVLFSRFSLDEPAHREIVSELEARRGKLV